jgi:hypothetical protein
MDLNMPCDFGVGGWSGSKSTITEPTYWPIVPAPDDVDDDKCGAI